MDKILALFYYTGSGLFCTCYVIHLFSRETIDSDTVMACMFKGSVAFIFGFLVTPFILLFLVFKWLLLLFSKIP